MRPLSGFQHIRVKNLNEVWDTMRRYPGEALLLAGGTDLLVKLKKGKIQMPSLLISLRNIPELSGLAEFEDRVEIGPLVTVSELVRSELLRGTFPLLAVAASRLGSNQIRNLATIGGNLCNASPAGDLSVSLLCLQAAVEIRGPRGARFEKLESFFQGPGSTALKSEEILVRISVPVPEGVWGWDYQKLTNRKAMEIGTVNVAVGMRREQEICQEVRIALGAVSPTPIRARKAEASMAGKRPEPSLIEEVASMGAGECTPIDDIRASAAYRKEMAQNLIRRALTTAWIASGSRRKGR